MINAECLGSIAEVIEEMRACTAYWEDQLGEGAGVGMLHGGGVTSGSP